MQNVVSDNVLLGNNSGAGGIVDELTAAEVRTLLNVTSGAAPDQNLFATVTGDTGSTTADTTTDTITIAGGSGITTAVAGDTITITADNGDVPTAVARRTTDLPITDTYVTITFDTTDFENDDTVVDHDDVTNTSRITVKEAGLYEVYFQASGLAFTANGELYCQIESRLIKNGVLVALPGADVSSSGYSGGAITATEVNAPSTNLTLMLDQDDYLEVQIRFLVLNGQTGVVGNAVNDTIFWVAKMSGAAGAAGVDGTDGTDGTDGADGAQGIPGSGSSIAVQDEGVNVPNTPHTILNFIGGSVVATDAGGGIADITITGGGGGVTVEDEGTPLATVADTLDFVGTGVVASGTGTTKTITIAGNVPSNPGFFQATGSTNITGAPATIPLDLEQADPDGVYSTDGTNVTFSEAGWYWITMKGTSQIDSLTGGLRSTITYGLQADDQGNAAFLDIPGMFVRQYARELNSDLFSNTSSTIFEVQAGDVFRMLVISSTVPLVDASTQPDECHIAMHKIREL